MEEKITSPFNLYDLLVRLVPGALLLFLVLFWFSYVYSINFTLEDYGSGTSFLILLSVSYSVGVLLHGIARITLDNVKKKVFGGEPSKVFTSPIIGKCAVLNDESMMLLARNNCDALRTELNFISADSSILYAYMVSYTEMNDASRKSDQVNCLSHLCASLALVSVVGAGVCIACLAHAEAPWWLYVLSVKIMLLLASFSMYLAVDYARKRYSIVVRTYDILRRKKRAVEA